MPSCLRIATWLRALERFSTALSSFFFSGVLGDGDGDGGSCIKDKHYMEFEKIQAMVFSRFDNLRGS
jgi:hypothetical protein